MDGDKFMVTMTGAVDENLDTDLVKQVPQGAIVVLNLKGVRRINSLGMLSWRNLMTALSRVARAIYIEECTSMMVGHTSTVAGFMGRAQLLSVCPPYYCESCGASKEVTLSIAEVELMLESMACDKCGKTMLLDDVTENYHSIPAENRAPV